MIHTSELSAYALALSKMSGVGPKGVGRITEKFPTSDALFCASSEDLNDELGEKLAHVVLNQLRHDWRDRLARARDSIARHRESGIIVLAINDVAYPPLLKRIQDPPVLLYLRGSLSAIESLKAVAVVGTRTPTFAGARVAERVSGVLSQAGYTIVSGLAKGIDTHAHRGCLSSNGTTIAVLANPLDFHSIYPAENRPLAEEIIARHGALISETPLGEMAHRSSFVQRDRIQSGLSLAVFPIQTDVEGGTMHTVRFAERDNRLLFCPVPVEEDSRDRAWAGIQMLLRTNRAQQFDKNSYEQVFSRLQAYESVLLDREKPLMDAQAEKPRTATSGSLFEEPASAPASQTSHEQSPQKPYFDDAEWLRAVEQICRNSHIGKEKYNELVATLRKRLFTSSKRKGAAKAAK